MSLLNGPLDCHQNYLNYIALENCFDYFGLVESQRKEKNLDLAANYHRLRLLLNAMESMNTILDYFFHEQKELQGWNDNQRDLILERIKRKHPALYHLDLQLSTYKRMKHSDMTSLVATDLKKTVVSIHSIKQKIELDFNSTEDEHIISEAFDFWFEYNKDPDINTLLP